DGIRDFHVTGVQTCALPIWLTTSSRDHGRRPDTRPTGKTAVEKATVTAPTVQQPFSNRPATTVEKKRLGRPVGADRAAEGVVDQIGRASCRERGWMAGVAG